MTRLDQLGLHRKLTRVGGEVSTVPDSGTKQVDEAFTWFDK